MGLRFHRGFFVKCAAEGAIGFIVRGGGRRSPFRWRHGVQLVNAAVVAKGSVDTSVVYGAPVLYAVQGPPFEVRRGS
jgi:hypothetical protein